MQLKPPLPVPSALFFFASCSLGSLGAKEAPLNIANSADHPYCDPAGGRGEHQLTDEVVNEARVYDFYSRQATYYLGLPESPQLLPAFPGLDAGAHGHWGKHNQNSHQDGRWNEINMGSVWAQVFAVHKLAVEKAVNFKVTASDGVTIGGVFDPLTCSYPAVWEGGFVKFEPFRWGTSRRASPDGKTWYQRELVSDWGEGEIDYSGYFRHGSHLVFDYEVGGQRVLDFPCGDSIAGKTLFTRTLEFPDGAEGLTLRIQKGGVASIVEGEGLEFEVAESSELDVLSISNAEPGAVLLIAMSPGVDAAGLKSASANYTTKPSSLLNPGSRQWEETLMTVGSLGKEAEEEPYVVDTLSLPFDNPWKSVLQFTGIAFDDSGTAYVSNLAGDLWKVTGIDSKLAELSWQRIATGLNQPVGVHWDEDGLFVLCRDQITRLHDLNGDGEMDRYECYANDFGGYDRSHTHVFGLHRSRDGSFSFVRREQLCRTSPEGVTKEIAYGVRNCMAVGGAIDGPFLVGPQEGTWTPASAIVEVTDGEFYGLPSGREGEGSIASPLCFVPRGVENSSGGYVHIDSDQWGPYAGSFVGLSYGYGQYYAILRDTEGSVPQGAVVPLKGDFAAGVMRGDFHPVDGQLYTVGLDGWGDYSTQDGCFHRVRYTGSPVHEPVGFHAFANGLRVDFAEAVDAGSVDPQQLFAQHWNYEYSKQYGSPEYSVSQPESLGHDRLEISAVRVLNGGKSLFVEMPGITPVMQLHLHMKLRSASGVAFETDLYTTVKELAANWTPEGTEPVEAPATLALRVQGSEAQKKVVETGELVEGERKIVLNAASGLKFEQTLFEAKKGEALVLHFQNTDVMPHNVVFVKAGAAKKVGEASFKMLNDPKAGEKHYVPDVEEVFANTHVINPGNRQILHFRAPEETGDHHFICTFPGHWMTMQGILRVE